MIAHSQPNTPRPYPLQVIRKMNEFSPPFVPAKSFDILYCSDKTSLAPIQIDAKMDRGFFLANDEWTCYRRNYFQVSATFSLGQCSSTYYVQTSQGLEPVQRFLMAPSARVANGEKVIELVQQTAKRDKGPQFKPAPKSIFPGGRLVASHEQQSVATFERLQFRTATANNGKRRAAQQYFICMIDLFAETNQLQVPIATCQSMPLVVRGRSPGHYADIKPTVAQSTEVYYHYQPNQWYHEPKIYPPVSQDWQRIRYNSASSGSSSATSPYQESYFSQA
ncbi:unnamed protein product [Rhizopus stolonifer]